MSLYGYIRTTIPSISNRVNDAKPGIDQRGKVILSDKMKSGEVAAGDVMGIYQSS